MPLRYRVPSENGWHEGLTENISHSGVLFQAPSLLEENTPVEMSFKLPVEIGGEGGAIVVCDGKIVRTLMVPAADEAPQMAVKFSSYRLTRGNASDGT